MPVDPPDDRTQTRGRVRGRRKDRPPCCVASCSPLVVVVLALGGAAVPAVASGSADLFPQARLGHRVRRRPTRAARRSSGGPTRTDRPGTPASSGGRCSRCSPGRGRRSSRARRRWGPGSADILVWNPGRDHGHRGGDAADRGRRRQRVQLRSAPAVVDEPRRAGSPRARRSSPARSRSTAPGTRRATCPASTRPRRRGCTGWPSTGRRGRATPPTGRPTGTWTRRTASARTAGSSVNAWDLTVRAAATRRRSPTFPAARSPTCSPASPAGTRGRSR